MKLGPDCWNRPWLDDAGFRAAYGRMAGETLITPGRCWVLWRMARQTMLLDGEMWECGVYKGGSAALIADAVRDRGKVLRLFDTFSGIPYSDKEKDNFCKKGDFGGVSAAGAEKLVGYDKASLHVGALPGTFAGLEGSRVAFCHVDVDVYESVKACCEFVWPRMVVGGVMVFDDYDCRQCAGARLAVDEYFEGSGTCPVVTKDGVLGNAVAFKSFDVPVAQLDRAAVS